MKITIQGQDYTPALDAMRPLTVERKLNEPSICEFLLSLPADKSLAVPSLNQAISVKGDDGTLYFTGYIAVSPLQEYAGLAIEGPRFRTAVMAISDELLLDRLPMPSSGAAASETASALISKLVSHTGSNALSTQGLDLNSPVSRSVPEPGASWSKCAGQVANQARAAYRALNGALVLSEIPCRTHVLSETNGSLSLAALAFNASAKRSIANDVTVCGQHEPTAYVTEYFMADGITTQFFLNAEPFLPGAPASTLIRELFNEGSIDERSWANPGGPGYFKLGGQGLTMNGGNGIDGDTVLSWIDQVEMGGTLLLEVSGLTLSLGSTGVLCGFFIDLETQAGCIAGLQVTAQQGSGSVALQPLILGSPAGPSYPLNPANQYTLRTRVYCAESERTLAIYRSFGDSGPVVLGGQTNLTPGRVLIEVQEFINGVAGTPVTLYDGAVNNLPSSCVVVAASSVNLIGTMRSLSLINLGPAWVISTPINGEAHSRRLGPAAQGAECKLDRAGALTFFTGCTPQSGEQIAVSYRTAGRASGRAVNVASQQALAQNGLPLVASWIGTVTNPPARSSADCRNAALAIELAAQSMSAMWRGSYRGTGASFDGDVWPGDALQLNAPSSGVGTQVVVREVKLNYRASVPDLVEYEIFFANDWADDLSIKTSATVPEDVWLPAPVNPTVLGNLTGLVVTALNGSTVSIDAGVTPPTGGGFEIRRGDNAFMPGEDSDLVARASVPKISFSRESASDRFYIRMYDGSIPPSYSEFSTALFINLPLGS